MDLRLGRFGEGMSEEAAVFSSSLDFDKYIFEADVLCNIAHTSMLRHEKIIDEGIADRIIDALNKLQDEGIDALDLNPSFEDIHMAVENYVTNQIGEDAGFMHTAKSRNDQVATDIRLVLRKKIRELESTLLEFIEELANLASEHKETIMIGYTHLQHAQPITLAHHLMAYASSLKRDFQRLEDTYKRVNINPLGSAAMTTTTFPINRDLTTELLGFDSYMENSMDAVSTRDFIAETVFDLSMLTTNLSKIAEELVLWSTYEFGIIEISNAFSSTSSIMPQKKNPDIAELSRGKSATINGELVTILTILKALPYTYNRDLQEITLHLWNAYENAHSILKMTASMILTMKVNKERCKELANANFATATDLADLMVREKKIPFRTAHKIVGKIVSESVDNKIPITQINKEFIDEISEELTGKSLNLTNEQIQKAIDPLENVKSRTIPGGPSPKMVEKAITDMKVFVGNSKDILY